MQTARRPMLVGNWKMNVPSQGAAATAQAAAVAARDFAGEVVICPPAILLTGLRAAAPNLLLGGQDCHMEAAGAFTGDISAAMLRDAGCDYVILGHSERRARYGESDATVRRKALQAQGCGLRVIICVGESAAERQAGRTERVLTRQLQDGLPPGANADNAVIAYEPVWAIGAGESATPQQVRDAHAHLRRSLAESHGAATAARMRILYGGSLNPDNAADLLTLDEVDGGLVGGASLRAADFLAILRAFPGA